MALQKEDFQPSPAIRRIVNLYAAESFCPGVLPAAKKLKDNILKRKRYNSEHLESHHLSTGWPDAIPEHEPIFSGRNVELHKRLQQKKLRLQIKNRNHFRLTGGGKSTTANNAVQKWSTESSIDYF